MHSLTQRRTLIISLFLSTLLMLLARPITVLCLSVFSGSAPTTAPQAEPVVATARRTQVAAIPKHAVAPATKALTLPPVLVKDAPQARGITEFSGLPLQSVRRDYTIVFQGQLSCAGRGCAPSTEVIINTERNPDKRQMVTVNEDGSFWVEVPLSELAHEQLDWRIVARDAALGIAEAHGRQILADETRITLDRDLALK